MAAKYWIKLYHEILHDRKMVTLEHRLWRRVIECFLLAGEMDEGGYLPPMEDVAFTLREDSEQLETDYNELIRVGVLEFRDGRYFVRKFAERQDPMPKAEYMRRKRDGYQKEDHYQGERYQDVTNGNAEKIRIDTDKIRKETDTEVEKTTPQRPNIFAIYEREVGALTQFIAEDLKEIQVEYPDGWFEDAVKEAKRSSSRVSLKYIWAILKRWKADGRGESIKARQTGKQMITLPDGSVVEATL